MVSLYKHGGKIIVFNGLMVGDILEFRGNIDNEG